MTKYLVSYYTTSSGVERFTIRRIGRKPHPVEIDAPASDYSAIYAEYIKTHANGVRFIREQKGELTCH